MFSQTFLITGLKRVSKTKNLIDVFQRSLRNVANETAAQETTIIDFKSLFTKLSKSTNNSTKAHGNVKPKIELFKNPAVSFYSDDFVNKIILMLESKGCEINKANSNKIPRFLYHLTTKSNYEKMLETGAISPAKEGLCGENIFMLDIKNFFKRWTKFNLGGSHQKRLLAHVSGANKEDVVLLKIPTKQLQREKLGIRSQDVLYSNAEYLGAEQVEFMKKYNCKTEEEVLQLLENDETAFNKFANMFKRYLHLTRGTNAGNQRLFTTRKDAIEYIYPDAIDIKSVQKIGQINPSDFELTSEFNPEKPMQSVFGKLLSGQPEQKGALLIQG